MGVTEKFAMDISRELGNINATLLNVVKKTDENSGKIDSLKESVHDKFNTISGRVYRISGGIAVVGVVGGVLFKMLLA